ncbi:MAG: glutamate ligase domain-containing protein, partial [Marinirhabdus sp.]
RPRMAKIAAQLSNKVIFTSDNPRTENPETIIQHMEAGVPPEHFKKTIAVTDREQAIKAACQMAQRADIILIAGKGHETYQESNGGRTHFDDFETVNHLLTALNK